MNKKNIAALIIILSLIGANVIAFNYEDFERIQDIIGLTDYFVMFLLTIVFAFTHGSESFIDNDYKKNKEFLQDGWSWVHLLCGFIFVTNCYYQFYLGILWSTSIALAIDWTKEILDDVFARHDIFVPGFDPAGSDYRDIFMALMGTIIGQLVILCGQPLLS